MKSVLFVCLGNICRSPLAEGILRRQADELGIAVQVDSAGTGDWHSGELPDRRARQIGITAGCKMTMRARQVRASDFEEFDLIVPMDQENVRDLAAFGTGRAVVRLARSFDQNGDGLEVPDPYYGSLDDFVQVGEMLEASCAGILEELRLGRF